MDDQILTIAIFDNSFDAECAKARLEAEGIPAFLMNSHAASIRPSMALFGGVRLQVPASRAEEAVAILGIQVPHPAESRLSCPSCGGDQVAKDPLAWATVLLYLLSFGLGVFLLGRQHTCKACGYHWRVRS